MLMGHFYFKSFDRTIGMACDVQGLYYEIKCLALYDKAVVDYHVKEGHIAMWLDYIGDHNPADIIRNENETESVLNTLENNIKKNNNMKSRNNSMHHGSGMKGQKKHRENM
jgi:hypothetical protein